jgi:hypothetical protein
MLRGEPVKAAKSVLIMIILLIAVATGAFGAETKKEAVQKQGLEVAKVMVTTEGTMIDIRFRLTGTDTLSADPEYTYIQDERTGEKLFIASALKIGRLAPRNLKPRKSDRPELEEDNFVPLSYLIIANPQKKIKVGSKVTVVIGGLKQEHMVVEE